MKSLYLAAPYGWRADVARVADDLQAMGHRITSTWLWHPETDEEDARAPCLVRGAWALECLRDIDEAQVAILFTRRPGRTDGIDGETALLGRGGKDVEFGYALARGRHALLVCGPPTHGFCCLPHIARVADERGIAPWLAREEQSSVYS